MFLLIAVTFSTSLNGVFLFDDTYRIVENPAIRSLWPITPLLKNDRPVVEVSLAVNYAIGRLDPRGYHIVNILIHALAALTLAGVIRRTLRAIRGADAESSWLPWLIPALWAVHPLQTQSVTYVIQRSESLMGLFYLLTLYCAIRRRESKYPRAWLLAATLTCAMGMAAKAVMVTAPILVWLHDVIFWHEGSTRRKLTQFIALASTWSILVFTGLAAAVLDPTGPNTGVGFSVPNLSTKSYLLTQAEVILHYLRLSLWPTALCLDYDWPFVKTAGEVLPELALILSALLVTALGVIQRHSWAFAGAWFFLILAPTSSVIPVKDAIFEHRMYLPLAAVVAFLVILMNSLIPPLQTRFRFPFRAVAALTAIAALSLATIARNKVYANELTMWQDVATKRPTNARARTAIGNALLAQGRIDEAVAANQEAVRIRPDFADGHAALGMALARKGLLAEAVAAYQTAITLDPLHAKAHYNLANTLARLNQLDRAVEAFRKSLELRPDFVDARCNLGNALTRLNRLDEAEHEFREAIRIDPAHAKSHNNLGDLLRQKGRLEEAIAAFRRAVDLDPDYANAHANLAAAYLETGQLPLAAKHAQQALTITPDHPTAGGILREARNRNSNP